MQAYPAELLRAPPQRRAQIGPADVADEEGVARQHRVGNLLAVLGIEHEDRDRLRRVSGRLEPHQPYCAHLHLRAVADGLELVLRARTRAQVDGRVLAIAQLQVAREEVRVEVRQKDVSYRAAGRSRVGDVLIDVALGIDHRRLPGLLIGDQIAGVREAAEVILLEDHPAIERSTGSPASAHAFSPPASTSTFS